MSDMAAGAVDVVESLRPRGALELIDDSASLLRRRWGDVSILAVVALAPSIVLSVLLASRQSVDGSFLFDVETIFQLGQSDQSTLLSVSKVAVGSLSLAMLTHSLTRLVLNDLVNRQETPWQVLRLTLKSFHRWAGAWVLVRLLLGLGFLLCGVGIAWPWVVFWVAIPVVAAEELSPVAAIRRCRDLTKGTRGRVFGVALLVELTAAIIQLALFLLPAQIAAQFVDERALALVLAVVGSGVVVVVEIITAATMVNTYLDLRVRREGLDLDLRMRALS